MSDFDWIVEYETLPPDDRPTRDAEPDRPHRKLPRWLWLLVALVTIAGGAVAILWKLGGEGDPLPNPDVKERIDAVVQLELSSMHSGDQETFERIQDYASHRTNPQPPADAWFEALRQMDPPPAVRLADLEIIGEEAARAEVELDWSDQCYRLTWFYQLRDERWVHTDWASTELGETEKITAQHIQVIFHPFDREQATALAGRLESFVARFCATLPCPAQIPQTTVTMDPLGYHYYAQREGEKGYTIASPLRVRWPGDGSPEPLILASLGRHLADDLYLQPHLQSLTARGRLGFVMATVWLTHHLLELDVPIPATLWLEKAAARDGLPAVVDLIHALEQGRDPQQAVADAFRPETVAAVTALPDYFGWLLVISDSDVAAWSQLSRSGTFGQSQPSGLIDRLDIGGDPWAANGQVYWTVTPEIAEVRYRPGWAIASIQPGGVWGSIYYFRQSNEGTTLSGPWFPSQPDETLLGPQQTRSKGSFTIIYHELDEPFVDGIMETLAQSYREITTNFGITSTDRYTVALIAPITTSPISSVAPYPDIGADIFLTSPSLRETDISGSGRPADIALEASWNLVSLIIDRHYDLTQFTSDDPFLFFLGIVLWQVESLGVDLDQWLGDMLELPDDFVLRLPATPNDPDWIPLNTLWAPPEEEPSPEQGFAMLTYPVIVVDYLVQQHGRQALPALMEALKTANSLESWIGTVSNQPFDQFELAWRRWAIDEWKSR